MLYLEDINMGSKVSTSEKVVFEKLRLFDGSWHVFHSLTLRDGVKRPLDRLLRVLGVGTFVSSMEYDWAAIDKFSKLWLCVESVK